MSPGTATNVANLLAYEAAFDVVERVFVLTGSGVAWSALAWLDSRLEPEAGLTPPAAGAGRPAA
jgi:hypothetical protein